MVQQFRCFFLTFPETFSKSPWKRCQASQEKKVRILSSFPSKDFFSGYVTFTAVKPIWTHLQSNINHQPQMLRGIGIFAYHVIINVRQVMQVNIAQSHLERFGKRCCFFSTLATIFSPTIFWRPSRSPAGGANQKTRGVSSNSSKTKMF